MVEAKGGNDFDLDDVFVATGRTARSVHVLYHIHAVRNVSVCATTVSSTVRIFFLRGADEPGPSPGSASSAGPARRRVGEREFDRPAVAVTEAPGAQRRALEFLYFVAREFLPKTSRGFGLQTP